MQKELMALVGHNFANPAILTEAMTHSSYAHENRRHGGGDNERLEFLGDAVLGLAAASALSIRFPEAREGELSRIRAGLVGEKWLSEAARRRSLGTYLLLGRGEEQSGGREKESILAAVVEALLGAVFNDGGWDPAYRFAAEIVDEGLRFCERDPDEADSKTRLQEICQEKSGSPPLYRVLSQTGPSHSPTFTVAAFLGDDLLAEGRGTNKKNAEQAAASEALRKREELHDLE